MIINQTITVAGDLWIIREAKSIKHAENEIAMARVTGSVGSKSVSRSVDGTETVIADVNRLNADGSLRRPG